MKLLPEVDDNFRVEGSPMFGPRVGVVRRDFVEPVPVGTYIAMVFRVTGYDQDCDGGAMARLEQVDVEGKDTGWEQDSIGLYPDGVYVLEGPNELHNLCIQNPTK